MIPPQLRNRIKTHRKTYGRQQPASQVNIGRVQRRLAAMQGDDDDTLAAGIMAALADEGIADDDDDSPENFERMHEALDILPGPTAWPLNVGGLARQARAMRGAERGARRGPAGRRLRAAGPSASDVQYQGPDEAVRFAYRGALAEIFRGRIPLGHHITFEDGGSTGAGSESREVDNLKRLLYGGIAFFASPVEFVTAIEIDDEAVTLPPGGVSIDQAAFGAGLFGSDYPENLGVILSTSKFEKIMFTATYSNLALDTVVTVFPFDEATAERVRGGGYAVGYTPHSS